MEELGVLGDHSSEVIALAAQASDLGSIPSDFPVSFPHSFFSLSLELKHLSIYVPGYLEPSKVNISCLISFEIKIHWCGSSPVGELLPVNTRRCSDGTH